MNSMNNGSPIEGGAGHSSASKLEGWLERGGILRALFDDAPQGVIVTRSDGIIQECNQAAARMLGYTPEELTGLRFNEITHPEDVGIGMQQLRALVSGDKSHATFTKRYLRKDGAIVWVRLDVSPIRGVEGPVQFFVTSVDDISADKLYESALRDSEQRLRSIVDALPCLFFQLDREGTFVDYRRGSEAGLYAAPEVFLGKRIEEVMPPDLARRMRDALDAALRRSGVVKLDYQMPRVDGELRDYEAQVSAYGQSGVVAMVIDVTDRNRAAQAKERTQSQIIEAQREVLRQLSTPLISIAEGVIALPLVGPVDSDRAHQMLEALLAAVSAQRASTVILDITGVPSVDQDVAALFARATQASRLLGAEVLLSGVRPEVARCLIELGLDLGQIRTVGSFQTAIALTLAGKRRGA